MKVVTDSPINPKQDHLKPILTWYEGNDSKGIFWPLAWLMFLIVVLLVYESARGLFVK